MITGLTIRNFRGFRDMTLDGMARVNLLVGDNGSGKTALLEALFLAMSNSPMAAPQLRHARGLRGRPGIPVSPQPVAPEAFSDFFTESADAMSITTRGTVPFGRHLSVRRDPRRGALLAPGTPAVASAEGTAPPAALPPSTVVPAPLVFTWQDSYANVGEATVQTGPAGIAVGASGVSFVGAQFLSAGQDGQGDAAAIFSVLDRDGEAEPFIAEMKRQFKELEVIAVQLEGMQPLLHARVAGQKQQRPLEMLSGGVTRLALILLAIAAWDFRIVLIDEIENGLHHSRFKLLWQQVRAFAERYGTQVFATTHSLECLDAAADAMSAHPEDFAFIRTTRLDGGCTARLLPGADASHLLRSGLEVRG